MLKDAKVTRVLKICYQPPIKAVYFYSVHPKIQPLGIVISAPHLLFA